MDEYEIYPIFTSLQRPYEFMGLKGRYIFWVFGGIMIGLIIFFALYTVFGFTVGAIGFLIVGGGGVGLSFLRQKKGLHTKNEFDGIIVYKKLFKIQDDWKKKQDKGI